jgi:hypothetical protein
MDEHRALQGNRTHAVSSIPGLCTRRSCAATRARPELSSSRLDSVAYALSVRLDRRSLLLLYNLTRLGFTLLCTSVLRAPGLRPVRFKIYRFKKKGPTGAREHVVPPLCVARGVG